MSIFTGNCPAIVTPFTENGKKVNYDSFKKLIDFQIENGANAIVFLGTTGEASTLTEEEKLNICKFAVEYVNGRMPVILGCGSNNTQSACVLAAKFENLGANALLCVTPYYNKCTQKGLILHYKKIARSTNLPIILYNVPGRTGVNIEPKTALELSKIKNIVAIKEASGNMNQIVDLFSLCGDKIDIYSGDDNLILPILAMGGKGVISVLGNIKPKEVSQLCDYYFNYKIEKAQQIQKAQNKLIKALFSETNPIPLKTALNFLGFDVGPCRLPLCKMGVKAKNNLIKKLKTK